MEQYKILGVDENATMEEVRQAYEDKVNKFKNEIKNERRAKAFIKVFDKAYEDIKAERESSQLQQTMIMDIKESDLAQYSRNNTDINNWDEDDEFEDESWDYDEDDNFDEYEEKFIINKVKKKVSSKKRSKKKQKVNEKKPSNNKGDNTEKSNKDINKNTKKVVVKEKKKTSVISTLIQLPLKILALPIIAVLAIIIFFCKIISLISWFAAKILVIASIAACAIHGYQVYIGHAVQYKIFILSGVAFTASIFLPSILRIVPSMLVRINNSLKRFVF